MMKMQNVKRKRQNQNSKFKTISRNLKFYILTFSFTLCALSFAFNGYAKEITILYTGETHAMLYPCNCPIEPDGGVARRATLIKKLRAENPNTLLLDSGSFFAGGLLDEYTQNTQLDMQRSIVNLKAMELMKYDAANIGDNEFNFGRSFLEAKLMEAKIPFLSCNIEAGPLKSRVYLPYIIKEISGIKIGIVGVTNLSVRQKAQDLKFMEPKASVIKCVAGLKKSGVDIIVLLSQLEESEDYNWINEIKDIDILIGSRNPTKERPYLRVGNTLILKPFWQGKSLGKLTLTVENNKITSYKVEALRLSDQISDDADILTILPRCFSDAHCKKEGLVGNCQNPGTPKAACLFSQPNKIDLTIITTKSCRTCNTDSVVNFLKKKFPGLNPIFFYYPDKKAESAVKDFGIFGLPAYLLSNEVQKERDFDSLKANLEAKGDFYVLRPQFSGISYFLNRNKIKGKLDLFLSLYDKNSRGLLGMIKEFNPAVHFLASDQEGKLDAAKGEPEVEEYLRSVCVQKYYPESFWDYISCRAGNINSSWWDECAINLDAHKIKSCAMGSEGKALLRENIAINKELQILFGPTYLLDNQEVFSSDGVPKKEELEAIMKR